MHKLISLEDWHNHYRFNTRIFELSSKGFSDKQINEMFIEMKNNVKSEEVFDFIRGGFQLLGNDELDWGDAKLQDFIIQRKNDFIVEDLWKMILEENSYFFDLLDDQNKRITMEYFYSNTQTALIILIALLGQEEVENSIISNLSVLKVNNYALHRLSGMYQQLIEHHYLHCNLDFLVQLFEVLFNNFPKLIIREDDARDFLLTTFIYLYKSIPTEYSENEFENLLIKNGIEKVDDEIWIKELNLKQAEVLNFIKNRATFSKIGKGSIWYIKLSDDDRLVMAKILRVIEYKTKNSERIEKFLSQNKLTKIGEIRYLLNYSENRSYEDEMTNRDVVDCIKNNAEEFSFDEIFDRVVRSQEGDRMLIWFLCILALKQGAVNLGRTIVEAYEDKRINKDSFFRILCTYQNLRQFNIDIGEAIDLLNKYQIKKCN